jgi:hypothetical protein
MSSLSPISHRLFAAAIGHADRASALSAREREFNSGLVATPVAIAVELLRETKTIGSNVGRPPRRVTPRASS